MGVAIKQVQDRWFGDDYYVLDVGELEPHEVVLRETFKLLHEVPGTGMRLHGNLSLVMSVTIKRAMGCIYVVLASTKERRLS